MFDSQCLSLQKSLQTMLRASDTMFTHLWTDDDDDDVYMKNTDVLSLAHLLQAQTCVTGWPCCHT